MNRNFSKHTRYSRNFIIRAESVYDQLKSAEKSALDAILTMDDFNIRSTVNSVAVRSGCSDATITRLSKRLGYGGFPEMKESMFSVDTSSNVGVSFSGNESLTEGLSSFFDVARNTLTDTEKLIRTEDIREASEMIKNAGKLMFVGTGDAALIAHSGYYKFYRAGYDARCTYDYDEMLVQTSKLSVDDVLIAISYSGMTRMVLEVIKRAKGRDAKIIVITAYPLSRIAKAADIVLLTPAFTTDIYNEVVSKRLPAMALLEILYFISTGSDEKIQENIEKSNEDLEINKLDNLPDRVW